MRRGFTFLEILLTVTLLVILTSCIAFNFVTVKDKALLDDGVINIQTLIRFSKSHSEIVGKPVKILFPEAELGDEGESLRQKYPNDTIVVLVDGEPLETVKYYVESINNSVHVESSTHNEIIFYPDGMNQSCLITVGSVSVDDPRKLEISINAFTTKIKDSDESTDSNF